MSRFEGLPPDYDPWFVLSARTAPEGGALAAAVVGDPAFPLNAARELVVLVHGFNNHMGEAGAAYASFRDHQYPLAGVSPPSLETEFADFFWPGDADMGLLDKLDFTVYPEAVHTSPAAGQRLASYLATLPNLLTIDFVGHSLGCRVVLECIRQMVQGPHPVIRRVVLMAAAVPVDMVSTGGTLASAVQAAEQVLVLHSTSDIVLHFAFPPGQTQAGEGMLPTALGRFGPPPGMPGVVLAQQITDAGHGDYWGVEDAGTTPASVAVHQAVATAVAASLKLGSITRDAATPRGSGATTLVSYPRQAASVREIPSRTVGSTAQALPLGR